MISLIRTFFFSSCTPIKNSRKRSISAKFQLLFHKSVCDSKSRWWKPCVWMKNTKLIIGIHWQTCRCVYFTVYGNFSIKPYFLCKNVTFFEWKVKPILFQEIYRQMIQFKTFIEFHIQKIHTYLHSIMNFSKDFTNVVQTLWMNRFVIESFSGNIRKKTNNIKIEWRWICNLLDTKSNNLSHYIYIHQAWFPLFPTKFDCRS